LSSLLLGLQNVGEAKGNGGSPQIQFNVDHRFARNERLGFMAFFITQIQVAARFHSGSHTQNGAGGATTPWRKVAGSAQDQARIICNGEIPLNAVPAGQYTLELTVSDEVNM